MTDGMSRELAPRIDLGQMPTDITPLHALDDGALAQLFAVADRLAASSFLWACGCVEEFRIRYSQHQPGWYAALADRLRRSHSTIIFYSKVWHLYESIQRDPALCSRVQVFTSLQRGVLWRLAQVKETNRLEAARLVLDMADEGRIERPIQVRRFLEGRGLLSARSPKKWMFGPPLNFRELRHEPVNELGVVYLFGMVARELGFLVEGVAAQFPDCVAKRLVKPGRYVPVRIEFELKSSNFRDHGHDPKECDLIVCWEHDWPHCPLDWLDLKSKIQQLNVNG